MSSIGYLSDARPKPFAGAFLRLPSSIEIAERATA